MKHYPFELVRHNDLSYDYEFYDGDDKISAVLAHDGDGHYFAHYVRLVKGEDGRYTRFATMSHSSPNARKLFATLAHICLQFGTVDNPDFESISFDFVTDKVHSRIEIFLMLVGRIMPPEFELFMDDEENVLYIMPRKKVEKMEKK